jgi:MFS family permease
MDKRGLATGIAFSGSGLLVAFLMPLANRFIELHGWRWTYRFLGCVALLILMPVILIIVKDKPENAGLEPYCINSNKEKNNQSNSNTDTGLTRNEALRAPMFWFLAIAVMGITLSQAGPHIHTVSFISDIGYSAAFASAIASAYFIFLTGFKVVMGIAFDRFGSFKGSMMIGGACALFPIFALLAGFPVFPWVYAFVLGLASSGATILGPVLTADYFGRKDFSRIYSLVSMFSYIGVTISSPLFGSIHDATGSYTPAWFFAMGMGIIVCVCLFGSHLARKKLTSKE